MMKKKDAAHTDNQCVGYLEFYQLCEPQKLSIHYISFFHFRLQTVKLFHVSVFILIFLGIRVLTSVDIDY